MTNQAFPSLNDIAPSWADISGTFQLLGQPGTTSSGAAIKTADFQAISWGDSLDVGEQRGPSGGRVMKRTVGSVSNEASATFYKAGLRTLVKEMIKVAPQRGKQRRIGLVAFNILIQHTPPGETEIFETLIKGCRIMGRKHDLKEGNDADLVEVKLNPIEIVDIVDGVEVVLI